MSTVELRAGPMRCELAPALGGCITGLWLDETAVLRTTPAASIATARQSASYPLLPYSNRIADAAFEWNGQARRLSSNNPPEPHAIHGVGWQREWQVQASTADAATLRLEHGGDADWPFAFAAEHVVRLGPQGLTQALSITNRASEAAPVGLGWHPWFAKRARSRIAFEATGRWEMGADKLPTHRAASRGLDADCAFLAIDHCFDGWNGVVHLRDELLHVRIRSDQRRLVVCTDDTRDSIAIEPVSHVNNALALGAAQPGGAPDLGLRTLAPGESFTAAMSIEVERAR